MSRSRKAHQCIQSVSDDPDNNPMYQVQRKRYASKILTEARLEELLEPWQARHCCDREECCPEEIEPFRIKYCLRFEMRQPDPSWRLGEESSAIRFRHVIGGHTTEVERKDKHVEEDKLLKVRQSGKQSRKFVLLCEQIKVAKQHSRNEHCAVVAVRDVEEVEYQSGLAAEPGVLCAPRECGECGIDNDRSFEFNGDRPDVRMELCSKTIDLGGKDKAVVFEHVVPFDQFFPVCIFHWLQVNPQSAPLADRHECEGNRNDGQVKS